MAVGRVCVCHCPSSHPRHLLLLLYRCSNSACHGQSVSKNTFGSSFCMANRIALNIALDSTGICVRLASTACNGFFNMFDMMVLVCLSHKRLATIYILLVKIVPDLLGLKI